MAGDSDLLTHLLKALSAFDDTALAALTSVGLVRRARKDLEKETVRVDPKTDLVQIFVGEVTVSMTRAGPPDARCSCPAGEKCRHVLVAIMHLKETFAPPLPVHEPAASAGAELMGLTQEDLAKSVGRKTLREAMRLIEGATDIQVIEDAAVTVRFPSSNIECRFFPGTGLGGAVTTAPAKLRDRFTAAAVLAFQRHHGIVHEIDTTAPATKTIDTPRTPQQILRSTIGLLEEMIAVGITHVSGSVRDRLLTLSISCTGSNLPRLSLLLKSLADEVSMALRRDAGADDVRMFNTMARTYALCNAIIAAGASPPLALIGQSRSRYDASGTMELTGVGAYTWRTRSGYHGLTVLFWDANAKQFCSWSDSRRVNQDPSFNPVSRYEQELPWQGSGTARAMSRSRFKLSGASRNEDNRLSGSERCQAVILNDTDPLGVNFAHRAFTNWQELRRYLASVTPAGLAEYSPLDHVVVLKPAMWGPRAFISAEQKLIWALLDQQGNVVVLTVPFDAVNESAVRILEAIDPETEAPSAVVGSIHFDGDQLRLHPYSLLRNISDPRIQNLTLDKIAIQTKSPAAPNRAPQSMNEEERSLTAALSAIFSQWAELEQKLQQTAESGSRRMVDPSDLKKRIATLSDRGLTTFAAILNHPYESGDPGGILRLQYLCNLHRDLAIRSILNDAEEGGRTPTPFGTGS